MNAYFKDYKVKAYAKGFITCLRMMKNSKTGRYFERQVAVPVDGIRSIEELYLDDLGRGVRIIMDGPKNIDVIGAEMKHVSNAIAFSYKGTVIRDDDE